MPNPDTKRRDLRFYKAMRRGLWRFVRDVMAMTVMLVCPPCSSAEPALAATPPMGWNSWNGFELAINEGLIRTTADAIVASGMRDAGYEYVIVDAGWKAPSRDTQGRLQADPKKFPSGMRSLGNYIHSRGLKFGIYTDAGTGDCDSGAPGSAGHEMEDAETFAHWGVDYVKDDWCNTDGMDAAAAYARMSQALRATGRQMVFSVCEWGDHQPWLWAPRFAQQWRTTGDNKACWNCGADTKDKPGGYPRGWTLILDAQVGLERYAGPGHWNDPDMLEVGLPGLTVEESRAHFSLWAILAAPLIAGVDVQTMGPETGGILTNHEVIAVDQDRAGLQGSRVQKDGDAEVWARKLSDGGWAAVLFNRGSGPREIRVSWSSLALPTNEPRHVRDLWRHEDYGLKRGSFSARVAAHGVVMVRIEP